MGMIVIGAAISVGLPIFQAARSSGWSWWSASLFLLLSLGAVIAWFLGIPYAAYGIAKLSVRSREEPELGVWYGILLAVTWLAGIPLCFCFGFAAPKWLFP